MKKLLFLLPFVFVLAIVVSCGSPKEEQGEIVFGIEYPKAKDKVVLYSILPREMKLQFKNGQMSTVIKRANFQNSMFIDCNEKKVTAYYKYAKEEFLVNLSSSDVNKMMTDPASYKVELVDEEKEILGMTALKAIATNKADKNDKIEIWYTNDIALENSNWFHPFHEIPGVLLAYSIDRYGLRMEFKAKAFNKKTISDKDLGLPKVSEKKDYTYYNDKLNNLFKPFE